MAISVRPHRHLGDTVWFKLTKAQSICKIMTFDNCFFVFGVNFVELVFQKWAAWTIKLFWTNTFVDMYKQQSILWKSSGSSHFKLFYLKGLWEIPWELPGENFSRAWFLHFCNHCHHTNDHLKPSGQIYCPSRDIMWNVWFYELICGSTD